MDKKNQNDLVRNINKLLAEHDISAFELAKQTGIKKPTLYKILSGETHSPRGEMLQKIAKHFSVSVDQLLGKAGSLEPLTNIPLLNFENVVDWINDRKIIPASHCLVDANIGARAFGLIMQGSSMSPALPDGALLVFDPDVTYRDRGYVLAYLHAAKNIVVKQLLMDSSIRYLKSTHAEYQSMTTLTEKDKILATLIQSKINYV